MVAGSVRSVETANTTWRHATIPRGRKMTLSGKEVMLQTAGVCWGHVACFSSVCFLRLEQRALVLRGELCELKIEHSYADPHFAMLELNPSEAVRVHLPLLLPT